MRNQKQKFIKMKKAKQVMESILCLYSPVIQSGRTVEDERSIWWPPIGLIKKSFKWWVVYSCSGIKRLAAFTCAWLFSLSTGEEVTPPRETTKTLFFQTLQSALSLFHRGFFLPPATMRQQFRTIKITTRFIIAVPRGRIDFFPLCVWMTYVCTFFFWRCE